MTPEYGRKKLEMSLACLGAASVPHGKPVLAATRRPEAPDAGSGAGGASDTKFSIPLTGELASFDISLMSTGLMALRERDTKLNTWNVIAYQGNPGHIVDLVNDMLLGCRCSHLVEPHPRVH